MLSEGLGVALGLAEDECCPAAELLDVCALGRPAGELETGELAEDEETREGTVALEETGGLITAELETTGLLVGVDRLGGVELGCSDGVALGECAGLLDAGLLDAGWLDGGGVEGGTLVEMVGDGRGGVDETGPPLPAQLSRISPEVTTAPSSPITRTW